jgi:hypothetical protein
MVRRGERKGNREERGTAGEREGKGRRFFSIFVEFFLPPSILPLSPSSYLLLFILILSSPSSSSPFICFSCKQSKNRGKKRRRDFHPFIDLASEKKG